MQKGVILSNTNYIEMLRLKKELENLWSWKEFYEKRSKFVVSSYNKKKRKTVKKVYLQPRFVELTNSTQQQVEEKQQEFNEFKDLVKNRKRGGKR